MYWKLCGGEIKERDGKTYSHPTPLTYHTLLPGKEKGSTLRDRRERMLSCHWVLEDVPSREEGEKGRKKRNSCSLLTNPLVLIAECLEGEIALRA